MQHIFAHYHECVLWWSESTPHHFLPWLILSPSHPSDTRGNISNSHAEAFILFVCCKWPFYAGACHVLLSRRCNYG